MKTRVISAIVLFAITGLCVFLSPITRVLFFAIVAILCAYELSVNLEKLNVHVSEWVLVVYIVLQAVLTILGEGYVVHVCCFAVGAYLALITGILRPNQSGSGAVCTLALLIYPCFLFALIMVVSVSDIWLEALSLACLPVWVCDSFALFGGMLFGKHKLAPAISPKKTTEGAVCGQIFGTLMGVLIYFLSPLYFTVTIPLWVCIVTAFIASAMGQLGDLAESLIKRMINVKDLSNLIPGHGGMLDRADSLLFAIPTAYACLLLFFRFGV